MLRLLRYFLFIEDCSNKNLHGIVTHRHHIIPIHAFKTRNQSNLEEFRLYLNVNNCNDEENIIELSIDDHFNAHKILCEIYRGFDKHLYLSNQFACNHLSKQLNLSEEERLQYRLWLSERPQDPVANMQRSKSHLGKIHSESTKKKMRESRKTFLETDIGKEIAKKIGQKLAGRRRIFTETWKKNIQKAVIGRKHSIETNLKIGLAAMGRNKKPCVACGIEFDSAESCGKYHNIGLSGASYRLLSSSKKWLDWYYIDKDGDKK